MISDIVLQLVNHYGYLFFFLAFCLGPFGVPVPNELTILTGGILSNNGVLNPWIVYMAILAGLLIAISVAYFAGRIFGEKFKPKFQNNRHFQKAEKLFEQHGDIAMCFGMLIPVIRYILPVFVGLNGVSYKKFVLISYSSAFVWTITFFTIGKFFGHHILNWLNIIDPKLAVAALMLAVGTFITAKWFKLIFTA
ncbi:DedA family protein [Paenibacillus sp. CMAA1739]|uniref:DedA family protein n=1 Tax=Paenibacillus ottowii TaxID=2315729 RepID=UPI00272FCA9E|nr:MULTISPECIES: DedA family protein [Paenibacillus]MDP1511844.1 DedA family protein [Paenibacillus ottowii]MEC4567560.1 DedA family protein [Paenibacillus sp. CMAA1739]